MSISTKHDPAAIKASLNYLSTLGYEILYSRVEDTPERIFEDFVLTDGIAKKDGKIVFIQVRRFDNTTPDEAPLKKLSKKKRSKMEKDFYSWLTYYGAASVGHGVRFDILDVFVLNNGAAVVRHRIGVESEV